MPIPDGHCSRRTRTRPAPANLISAKLRSESINHKQQIEPTACRQHLLAAGSIHIQRSVLHGIGHLMVGIVDGIAVNRNGKLFWIAETGNLLRSHLYKFR